MPKITRTPGTTIRIWIEFTDPDTREPVDPNEIEFRLRAPDATVTTYDYGVDAEVVRSDIGIYYVRVLLEDEGTYHWKWTGVGVPGVSVVVNGDVDSVSRVDF